MAIVISIDETKKRIAEYADRLKAYKMLSGDKPEDLFMPEVMEYLSEYDGAYNNDKSKFALCFEIKGTRYEERTYNIEHVSQGDVLYIERETTNTVNPNNFQVFNKRHENIGVLPAELCNILAPIYDEGGLKIDSASVSFVDHILERSRYATKSVVFCGLNVSIG